jgi:cytochrome c-type biogenesis protein CcmH
MDSRQTHDRSNRGRAGMLLFLAALVLMVVGPVVVEAQGGGDPTPVREVTDDEVNAISHELYCPVCENIPLDVCGTEACARWRAQVRTLLEQGASGDEVIAYFVRQFGDRVVGVPQDPTLNSLSWAVPVAAVILGVIIVGVVFARWRSGGEPDAAPPDDEDDDVASDDDDYRARLERELETLE